MCNRLRVLYERFPFSCQQTIFMKVHRPLADMSTSSKYLEHQASFILIQLCIDFSLLSYVYVDASKQVYTSMDDQS